MTTEERDLAKEHLKIAEDIVIDEAKDADVEDQKLLGKAAMAIEKAETAVDESEEN